MKKNKKILLTLGTLASVAAPVAAVVSCGTSVDNGDVTGKSTVTPPAGALADYNYMVLPTYTGEADQLLSLGIKPDRYPFQLDKTAPFGYITDPAKYMIGQSEDFKTKFAAKLASLMPEDRGTSWWNQQALQDGEKGSDPEYWQHRYGAFTMYEHYLLDDGAKTVGKSTAIKHVEGSHTFAQTNFRESRDPFTRLPKEIMVGLLDKGVKGTPGSGYEALDPQGKILVQGLLAAARKVEGFRDSEGNVTMVLAQADPTKLSVDDQPAPSGVPQGDAGEDDSWLYNDYFFAKSYHEQFLDNTQFSGGHIHEWIINEDSTKKTLVFDQNDEQKDAELASLFFKATYTPQESALRDYAIAAYEKVNSKLADVIAAQESKAAPATAKTTTTSPHHPIYEQQEDIGGAPMFEGAQRDNMLYFYNTAAKIQAAFTDPTTPGKTPTPEEAKSWANLKANFHIGEADEDSRVAKFQAATANANTISVNLRTRMTAIKALVDAVRTANSNKLTFGLVTLAPGEGQTTLQTSSKYSFLYNELGFDQATPDNLGDMTESTDTVAANVPDADHSSTFFNMDDNGWWWNLGEGTDIVKNAAQFNGKLDMGLLTANDTQYNNLKGVQKQAVAKMFVGSKNPEKVDYNLWNEGLKTPFVMNMMLDKITDMLVKRADADSVTITEAQKKAAINWGDYWTTTFVA